MGKPVHNVTTPATADELSALLKELAALRPSQYARRRKGAARELGVPLDNLDEMVQRVQEHIRKASELALDGFSLDTDVVIVRPGERYLDKRSVDMWHTLRGVMHDLAPSTWDEVSGGTLVEA